MFRVKIDTSNAAFHGEEDGGFEMADETARILRMVAMNVERGDTEGSCYDINGNKVGWFNTKSRS